MIDATRLTESDRGKSVFFVDDASEEVESRLLRWDDEHLYVLVGQPHVRKLKAAHVAMVKPSYAESE